MSKHYHPRHKNSQSSPRQYQLHRLVRLFPSSRSVLITLAALATVGLLAWLLARTLAEPSESVWDSLNEKAASVAPVNEKNTDTPTITNGAIVAASQWLKQNMGAATIAVPSTVDVVVADDQTLSDILGDNNIASSVAHELQQSIRNVRGDLSLFRTLRKGDNLRFTWSAALGLMEMDYLPRASFLHHQFKRYTPSTGFVYTKTDTQSRAIRKTQFYSGTIVNSFYEAGLASGMTDNLLLSTVDLFKWSIDFVNDIRSGDSFVVMVENYYNSSSTLVQQQILTAQITINGKPNRRYRYEDDKGVLLGFYDEKGSAQKGRFLRMPLAFARVSSKFSRSRYHPVLGVRRPHQGVDYAAPVGTPIFSTADGVVRQAGYNSGYGNVVVIDHGGGQSTLYAHMRSIKSGIRVGKRVKQKEVIGYLGATGLATGPHLHYEFRINGRYQDPLKVKLAQSQPGLSGDKLRSFLEKIHPLKSQFESYIVSKNAQSIAQPAIKSQDPNASTRSIF